MNENRLMAVLAFVIFVPAAIFAFRDWREGKARLMLAGRASPAMLRLSSSSNAEAIPSPRANGARAG